jgi:uncharacterized protein
MVPDRKPRLTDEEWKALAEIKRRVAEAFAVEQFVIYGSKARGDAVEGSDVDLLVVTRESMSYARKRAVTGIVFEVNLAHGTNFSALVQDGRLWGSRLYRFLPLHQNIEREGCLV